MPRFTGSHVQSHHWRRRGIALALIAVLALVAGVLAGAGGGSTARVTVDDGTGYFSRLRTLAGAGPGSFLAAEKAAENAAIDRTLAYTPYVRIAGSQHREIALTFDDGPGPYTPQVVAALQQANVPATFFEVGIVEQDFHAGTSLITADGYPIGDHTENHAAMSQLSPRGQKAQLLEQTRAIARYGAPFPRLFRPPYGLWDNDTLALLHKYRMLMIMWTVDTSDYRLPGVAAIVHSVVSGARPGAIILMHDAGGNRSETVAAIPVIVKQLRARGYKFVTVPRLLLDNPAPQDQQISAVTGAG
ncbi:MAG TPA: polysaccharide deacetylase family protein [Solirubrobacteraceae bacterium]|nr:polysaccharide deacetylase family protein [Solirubrobacteraceae bacterium]